MYGFTKVEMNDHEFARWLRERGWDGDYQAFDTAPPFTKFKKPPPVEDVLAVAIYDNSKCTKEIYLREDLVDASEKQRR